MTKLYEVIFLIKKNKRATTKNPEYIGTYPLKCGNGLPCNVILQKPKGLDENVFPPKVYNANDLSLIDTLSVHTCFITFC